jgi:hypothetical protein
MPATAIRRRRGRFGIEVRVHARAEVLDRSRRPERRKSQARELGTLRVLMTTSRLQKLVRGILFK